MMERAQFEKLLTLPHEGKYEGKEVEFKGPGPISDDYLRAKVARAVMGMGNIRGSGIVIIGVAERQHKGKPPELQGLSPNDLESWRNNDTVTDKLASYMDPPAIFDLSIEEFQGKNFVLLEVQEFEYTPTICKRSYSRDHKSGKEIVLQTETCYVRSRHKSETVAVTSSQQTMQELIDLITEKAERKFTNRVETLNHYLIRSRSPKANDFTEGLIYYPEQYLSNMKTLLEEKHRVLLVGRSAAGKTVLAITLAKQLQETEHYKAFYLDISGEQGIDGRALYQAIRIDDRERCLYILDNCHITPEEISQFCTYWDLKHARCILISRSRAKESNALSVEESEDYFDLWNDVSIEVQSEELSYGILEKFVSVYQQQEPDRYIALDEDDQSMLREQHAHNLVISRIRLEAWREIGGRLSELTQEVVYESLCKKYLDRKEIDKIREALLALCLLWQYEIPAHNRFMKTLPTHELNLLEREKLLTHMVIQDYGTLYQPTLHPIEAQEIFKADIYCREGSVKLNLVEAEIIQGLRAYLLTEPPNYSLVYHRLHRQQQMNLLHKLLKDHELQICAQNRFERGEIFDATLYLYSLSRIDSSRAQELLHTLIGLPEEQKMEVRLLKGTCYHIGQTLLWIQKIDMPVAQKIVTERTILRLAQHVQTQSSPFHYSLLLALKNISPTQAKETTLGMKCLVYS